MNLIAAYFGVGFPYIARIHTAYIGFHTSILGTWNVWWFYTFRKGFFEWQTFCGETWPFWATNRIQRLQIPWPARIGKQSSVTAWLNHLLKLSKTVDYKGVFSPCFIHSMSGPLRDFTSQENLPGNRSHTPFLRAGRRFRRFYGFIASYAWRIWKNISKFRNRTLTLKPCHIPITSIGLAYLPTSINGWFY